MKLHATLLGLALIAASFAACDRIVDLTPLDANGPPDASDVDAPIVPRDATGDPDAHLVPPDAWISDAVPGD